MTDRFTIRAVVMYLGLVVVLSLVGGFVLSFVGKQIPDALIGLGSVALGSLGTLLARTGSEPQQVTNIPGEAVEVTDAE